jgi:group II intron reverse transcriptase/maturase
VEGRRHRVTELLEGTMAETPGSITVSTKLQRIAMLAKEAPDQALTTLAHHIDVEWLLEAYRRTRKDGARGVDGQDAESYAANLEDNIRSLLERVKSGTYRAPPVRRVHIPKGDGTKTRPIGVPTFEDKVLQRAVVMVLEAVYEQNFLDCSYGFRPGRSAHQALRTLREQLMAMGGGWVVEVDIQQFFDRLGHDHLRGILRQRVRDGVLLRLIDKWLNAGVLEAGCVFHPATGSPQGGVISPMLSNVYLHEVLDVWFERQVKPRLRGRGTLIRYADDALLLFSEEHDARRVMDVLPKRFGRYGLTLHPEKTRLVDFQKPGRGSSAPPESGGHGPGSFDLLGFMHFWARSRKGHWVVKQTTATGRLSRALGAIRDWCRRFRHLPVREQHRALSQRVRGHYAYYGITGNSGALTRYRHEVTRIWRKWLGRRSRRRAVSWEWLNTFLSRHPIPPAMIVHHFGAKP